MATEFERRLQGATLLTAEVLYYMPDHPRLLQTFMWQLLDEAPRYPRLAAFLDHWRREIEAVILRHPAVKDVAVVGVPDRLRGQVARAHVVVKEGAAVTADELLALCRDNLSPHKVPRFVVFTDSVPRNPAGKTVRRGLRDPAP